jgi:hypothetical protein
MIIYVNGISHHLAPATVAKGINYDMLILLAGYPIDAKQIYNIREYSKTDWSKTPNIDNRPFIENSKFHIKPINVDGKILLIGSSPVNITGLSTVDRIYRCHGANSKVIKAKDVDITNRCLMALVIFMILYFSAPYLLNELHDTILSLIPNKVAQWLFKV